jgi:hypothetical protein
MAPRGPERTPHSAGCRTAEGCAYARKHNQTAQIPANVGERYQAEVLSRAEALALRLADVEPARTVRVMDGKDLKP